MAEPLYPWVHPGGRALLQGLKAKPELNGQAVNIDTRDAASGRWSCRVEPFGELIKVRPENLAKPPDEPIQEEVGVSGEWLRRGVHAAVHSHEELAGQVVRVVSVDPVSGDCKCVVRATGDSVSINRANLRPLAGATASKVETASESKPTEAKTPATVRTGGSDWAAAELERRRLAEGFRSGFTEGATVLIQGLKALPDLNGKHGKLIKFDSQSLRWTVETDSEGVKAFNPKNLTPVDETKLKKRPKETEEYEEHSTLDDPDVSVKQMRTES